jgi:acetolactate synthase-1/3 small subunit
MKRFTIAILVNNQLGVVNRVTSMFRRRQFNIHSLTVSETETMDYSRITIQSEGDDVVKQQLINQLYKLPDVCSVKELDQLESVSRELMLIKMRNTPESRGEIKSAIEAFEGKILDYTKESLTIQMVGDLQKIDNFVNLMKDHEILEICRTGVVSLERGASVIRHVTQL